MRVDPALVNPLKGTYVTVESEAGAARAILSFLKLNISRLRGQNKVRTNAHLSLPYYYRDAISPKRESVISLDSISISSIDLVVILLRVFALTIRNYRHWRYDGLRFFVQSYWLGYSHYYAVCLRGARSIHFHYYAFRPDIKVLADLLIEDGREFHHVEYANFLDETFSIKATSRLAPNRVAARYMRHAAHFPAAPVSIAHVSIEPKISIGSTRAAIGFYSSGFYKRRDDGYLAASFAELGCERERTLLECLCEFAENAKANLIIFPHYSRGVEDKQSAHAYYSPFISEHVALADEASVSFSRPPKVGVTWISNVFWDRARKGLPTLLFKPPVEYLYLSDFESMRPFIVNDVEDMGARLVELLEANAFSEMELLFDGRD